MENTLCQVASSQIDFPFKQRVLKDANEPYESVLVDFWFRMSMLYIHGMMPRSLYTANQHNSLPLTKLLYAQCTIYSLTAFTDWWYDFWHLHDSYRRTVFSFWSAWLVQQSEGCSKNFTGMMHCNFIERNKRIMSEKRYCKIDLWMQGPTMARRCKVWLQELREKIKQNH